MELPSASYLLPSEAGARVEFAPDDNCPYPPFYRWRFDRVLELARSLPSSPDGSHGCTNYHAIIRGYVEWALPELTDDDDDENNSSHDENDGNDVKPIQVLRSRTAREA